MKQSLDNNQLQQLTSLGVDLIPGSIGELIELLPLTIDISDENFLDNPYERVIAQNIIIYTQRVPVLGNIQLCGFDKREELIDNLFDCVIYFLEHKLIHE